MMNQCKKQKAKDKQKQHKSKMALERKPKQILYYNRPRRVLLMIKHWNVKFFLFVKKAVPIF